MSGWKVWAVVGIACVFGLGCAHIEAPVAERDLSAFDQTALDRYIAEDDPSYEYTVVDTILGDGYTGYIIDMVSQEWRSPDEVDRTTWRHWLLAAVPDQVEHSTGLLFIGGGSNNGETPSSVPGQVVQAAQLSNSVAAELRTVPNQPLTFAGDRPRWEDALIAYTWDKFLRGGDDYWPARLPMTKAAVRAMDAIEDLTASADVSDQAVEHFTVVGGSKRGWTTWTAAAVDNRVRAFVPAVIDLLNIEPSFVHHYAVYGFWAPAVGDYEEMNLMAWMGHPANQELMDIVEPYSYLERYVQPKFIVNSTGDQFFLPDSSQFYYDDLIGEKLLRYVPNTDHGLGGSDAMEVMLTYYAMILNDIPRPEYSWTVTDDHAIRVETETEPTEVRLWQASNPEARDFRLMTIGDAWESTVLESEGGGVYVGRVDEPESGWTAFMVELTYPGYGPHPLKVTTEVHVVPDVLPYADEVRDVLPYIDNIDYEF